MQYLPTFLHPIAPPFELVNETKNGFTVSRCLRDSMENIFNFVCSIECTRKEIGEFEQAQLRVLENTNSTSNVFFL